MYTYFDTFCILQRLNLVATILKRFISGLVRNKLRTKTSVFRSNVFYSKILLIRNLVLKKDKT
jgi:hypothetical protein